MLPGVHSSWYKIICSGLPGKQCLNKDSMLGTEDTKCCKMLCGVATCHVKFSPFSKGKVRANVVSALQFTRCFCKSLRSCFLLTHSSRRPCCCKVSTTQTTWPAFKPRRWVAALQAARKRLRWWPWFSSLDIERNNLNQTSETNEYFLWAWNRFSDCAFTSKMLLQILSRTCLIRHFFPNDVFSGLVFLDTIFPNDVFSDFFFK